MKNRRGQEEPIPANTYKGYNRNRVWCPGKQGKASAHGEPLGEEELKAMKEAFNWTEEPL